MKGPSSRAHLKGIALAAACVVYGALASPCDATPVEPLNVYGELKDELHFRVAWDLPPNLSFQDVEWTYCECGDCYPYLACPSSGSSCPPTVTSHYMDIDLSYRDDGISSTVRYYSQSRRFYRHRHVSDDLRRVKVHDGGGRRI